MAPATSPHSTTPALRLAEAAVRLGISKRTLQRWITEGAIARIRYGERYVRIPVSAIEDFEKKHGIVAKAAKSGGLSDLLEL